MKIKGNTILLVLSLCLMCAGLVSYVLRVMTYSLNWLRLSDVEKARVIQELNLNAPLVVQYGLFLGLFLSGLVIFTWCWLKSSPHAEIKRSFLLSGFLILMLVANPLLSIYYLLRYPTPVSGMSTTPVWVLLALALLGFANYLCALSLWRWKKIGLYGFSASVAAAFIINIIGGIPLALAITGIAGAALLVFLLRPFWRQMT